MVLKDEWIEDIERGKGIRAAAYVRVSTGKQAKEGFSLEAQVDELGRLARQLGVSHLYWFLDAARSGIDFDRRKLNKILDLAERGEISRLLAVEIDRIGRNSRRLLNFFFDLRDYGVVIDTPEGELDVNSLHGLLISTIKSWSSQDDNERRRKASVAGKRESFRQKHWNRPVPLGYRRSGDWIDKIPGWQPLVMNAYDLFIACKNFEAVRKRINDRYCQLLQNPLTRDQVKRILSDSVYVGKPQHLGEVLTDASLAFVNEEKFVTVQEAIKHIRSKHKRDKVSLPKKLIETYGISALCEGWLELRHASDGGLVIGNGTRTIGDVKRQILKCKKCGSQRVVPRSLKSKTEFQSCEDNIAPLVYETSSKSPDNAIWLWRKQNAKRITQRRERAVGRIRDMNLFGFLK